MAPDYNMHLIEPARMTDEDFEKFSTSMGKVLKFMKLSASKNRMKTLMEKDEAYRKVDRKAARVLRECANISLDIDSIQEVVDVCKAWQDAQEDAAREAREEAREEARTASIVAIIKTARKYGATDEMILSDIMTQFDLSSDEAKNYLTNVGV